METQAQNVDLTPKIWLLARRPLDACHGRLHSARALFSYENFQSP